MPATDAWVPRSVNLRGDVTAIVFVKAEAHCQGAASMSMTLMHVLADRFHIDNVNLLAAQAFRDTELKMVLPLPILLVQQTSSKTPRQLERAPPAFDAAILGN